MKKLAIATVLAAAACGAFAENNTHGLPPGIARKLMAACDECATVQEVKKERRKGEGGAVGIVAGAAAGGLLGNQIGSGNGRTLATVGGAVAGGFAGNEVQKHLSKKEVWVTRVKLRDGSERRFEQENEPSWQPGTVVKIRNNSTLARL